MSVRTVERDLSALQQAGVPIWAEPGRAGGYCLSPERTLPPVNFTPDEAVAMAVALQSMEAAPFAPAAAAAMRKLMDALSAEDARRARELAARVHFLRSDATRTGVPRAVSDALSSGRVLRIRYQDRDGRETSREIEPLGSIHSGGVWFLVAWCRWREGVRAFRLERIRSVSVTSETPAARAIEASELDIPFGTLRPLEL